MEQLGDEDGSKIFLGGFSQGAQLAAYVQIAELNFALGGVIILSGYPIPPLLGMNEKNKDPFKNASYYGDDMNWMIWIGQDDDVFPPQGTMDAY